MSFIFATNTSTRAFTIIESLVAISILLAAIAGPLTLANNSLSGAVSSKEQLAAAYLGQDLLEYLRWVRDTHGFTDFLAEVGTLCSAEDPCAVDTTKDTFTGPTGSDSALKGSCVNPSVCALHYDRKTFQYLHTSSLDTKVTPFSRKLSIVRNPDFLNEVTATVVVSWRSPSGVRSVTLKENFMNWK
ncbi:MAG: type II secretion system protein [Patescibacteria group bacterium]